MVWCLTCSGARRSASSRISSASAQRFQGAERAGRLHAVAAWRSTGSGSGSTRVRCRQIPALRTGRGASMVRVAQLARG